MNNLRVDSLDLDMAASVCTQTGPRKLTDVRSHEATQQPLMAEVSIIAVKREDLEPVPNLETVRDEIQEQQTERSSIPQEKLYILDGVPYLIIARQNDGSVVRLELIVAKEVLEEELRLRTMPGNQRYQHPMLKPLREQIAQLPTHEALNAEGQ